MAAGSESRLPLLAVSLAGAVAVELALLRLLTRTLIHIPGLDSMETPIRVVAETGRLAFHAAVVLLPFVLIGTVRRRWSGRGRRRHLVASAAAGFVTVAVAGRLGWLPGATVAWLSIVCLLLALAAVWRGVGSVPLTMFVLGSTGAGVAGLAQGRGGGLSVPQVDALLLAAEIALVLAGISSLLLLDHPPSGRAVATGASVGAVALLAFTAAPSTVSILFLWTAGVPGWLPGIAHALALGALATTATSLVGVGRSLEAVGLLLIAAGGAGAISTYQTGLVVAGLLLVEEGEATGRRGESPDPVESRSDLVPSPT